VETPPEFGQRLALPFSNNLLLSRALTHRSFVNENPEALEDNERLEYLGDAVLDFAVAAWLYNHFPEMAEGELTRMRAALVGTEQLARFARYLDIGPAIRLGRGEDDGGGRGRSTLLCATFEAVVGALYLDAGIEAVEAFVFPLIEPVFENGQIRREDRDCKSLLQEWSQSKGFGIPVYRAITVAGPDHARIFNFSVSINDEVHGKGTGSSKQSASKAAACAALDSLGINYAA
jgi:ribonuclease-3